MERLQNTQSILRKRAPCSVCQIILLALTIERFKTLMRQPDILYKTLVGSSLQTASRNLYLHFNWHRERNVGDTCYTTLHTFDPLTKCCPFRTCMLVLCLIHVLVIHWSNCQQGCGKSKVLAVPEVNTLLHFPLIRHRKQAHGGLIRYLINKKKKASIFSPICSILTFLLYSYSAVWKEHIINKKL